MDSLQIDETLHIEQAARLINLSIKYVRREIANGSFVSQKKNGRILIDKHSFLHWKDNQSKKN
ncbi:helix-turn-helix domain-containing protein, partial [Campylobacter upsaliensis]|nr:helix-turn-helix domain-containing protein [Campylobacter upsaliensis]